VKFAVAAANIGLVLVATGIHAALITIAEVVKPNPIPDMPGVGRTASDYWQLFSETAPLTILITFIALLAWPAEQKTRAARNDRELAQSILRKGPFVDEILVLVLATLIAIVFVISIGRLDLSHQPKLIEPIPVLGPLKVIILVINFLGKLYFAYGSVRFWSSVLPRRSLADISQHLGTTKNRLAFRFMPRAKEAKKTRVRKKAPRYQGDKPERNFDASPSDSEERRTCVY
jgi:hypothetical protein